MAQPRHIVSQAEAAQFNKKREQMKGRELSREELERELKSIGYQMTMITNLVDGTNPPIIRVSRGRYAFNPNPVYITKLQAAFDRRRNVQQKKDISVNENKIVAAIKLLKQNGYRILKPKTEYEEV